MSRVLSRVLVAAALVMLVAGGVQAADQKQPIKIGAFFALSGPAAHIGTPTKLVAEMAVDQINKAGGINGRPLELIIGDTESDPAKAATIAKKFIFCRQGGGHHRAHHHGRGDAGQEDRRGSRDPHLYDRGRRPGDHGREIRPLHLCLQIPPALLHRGEAALHLPEGEEHHQAGAALSPRTPSARTGPSWLEKLAPDYGITLVAKESFGPKDTDMTAQLTKIKNAEPQAIICWTIGPAGAIVAKNKAQLGINLPLFQCHGQPGPEYIELAGKASEGDRMPSTKLMVAAELPDTDAQKKVIQNFIHLYTDVYHFDKQFPINTHSGYAWDAITIVADAMRKAGTDPKALRAAIEGTKGYVGVSGIYTLSPEDHNGLGPDSMVIIQVKDGKFEMAK